MYSLFYAVEPSAPDFTSPEWTVYLCTKVHACARTCVAPLHTNRLQRYCFFLKLTNFCIKIAEKSELFTRI